jgi:two-component system response regulator YesN
MENGLGLSAQDEHQLVGRIQLGDKPEVRRILNKALGKIFLSEPQDPRDLNITKALLIELFISVGRTALQRKSTGDSIFSLYSEAVAALDGLDSYKNMYSWTVRFFDKLSEIIYQSRDGRKFTAMEHTALFIKGNYQQDLTLDTIANAMNYSPYYLSRIFKDEIGITLIDYLTEIRISNAKKLLESTARKLCCWRANITVFLPPPAVVGTSITLKPVLWGRQSKPRNTVCRMLTIPIPCSNRKRTLTN